MSKCAKCGACSTVCPIYRQTGNEAHTARGKIHLLQQLDPGQASPALHEILDKCLLCGACRAVCPNRIDLPALVMAARRELPARARLKSFQKYLINKLLAHPSLLGGISGPAQQSARFLARHLPAESGLRYKLTLLDGEEPRTSLLAEPDPGLTGEALYFRGCLAQYLRPEIATATTLLAARLRRTGLSSPGGESCCGLAAEAAGDTMGARELAKRNILAFASAEGRPILTSCASCYAQLREYPRLLAGDPEWHAQALAFASRVRELSSYLAETEIAADGSFAQTATPGIRVLYHDPCHLRFPAAVPGLAPGGNLLAPPRKLLRQLPNLTLLEFPGGPQCCGQGGLFSLSQTELSRQIGAPLFAAGQELQADLILTSCSGCLLQWRQGVRGSRTKAEHLAVFLAAKV